MKSFPPSIDFENVRSREIISSPRTHALSIHTTMGLLNVELLHTGLPLRQQSICVDKGKEGKREGGDGGKYERQHEGLKLWVTVDVTGHYCHKAVTLTLLKD